MIRIGEHRFSVTDARKTLSNAPVLLDQMAEGRDATVLEGHRQRVLAALAGLDVARHPADGLEWPLRQVWSALLEAGPALRAAGELPARAEGTVVRLSRSGGGVPKSAVGTATVGYGGVAGDVQASRVHHGRPWQALCLWSLEVIDDFRSQGHLLEPGAAGENVTLAGLEWSQVRPGVRLGLGTVLCEVSAYTLPCAKNARWFEEGQFRLAHHERGPVSRVYATVLEPGRITVGDAVVLEP